MAFNFIKSRGNPSLAEQHPLSGLPLVLVSGLGRSGTTVLRNCVCNHSEIAALNHETNYIFDLMTAADGNLKDSVRVKSMPVSVDSYWRLHQQLLLNMNWPADRWKESAHKAIATYSMLDIPAATGLKKAFPNLAVCYIVRNGIEVVSSYVSFGAFAHLGFRTSCELWAFIAKIYKFQETQDHFFLFRHEWLHDTDKVKQQLTSAFESVGLSFDPKTLQPLAKRYHPTQYDGESKSDANDPQQRKDRWKLWSDQEREIFVEVCGEAMNAIGYEIPWN